MTLDTQKTFTRVELLSTLAEQLAAADLYYGHGTDNAWDEAAWLLLHALGLSPLEPMPEPQQAVPAQALKHIARLLEQRVSSRQPLAHIIKSSWFYGLEFYVDERVLVPRSPIAELIGQGFSPWLVKSPSRILDLCTGSACIAIACAQVFPAAQLDASDLSVEALAVAKINQQRYELQQRLQLWQADVFDGLPKRAYDLIVSNPPYVDAEDMAALPEEYRREPEMGLAAGADGLDIVRRILRQAADYLEPQGILVVEVGNSEAALIAAYPHVPFVWLEFEMGGHGIFLLTAEDLRANRAAFA